MKKIVDAQTMKAIDKYTINEIGLPSMVLMERAALAVAREIIKYANKDDRILAVCGTGNNGADGVATARILKLKGYKADVLMLGDEEKCSKESKEQINIAKNFGISIYNKADISEYTIIIDSMFGIGLNSQVRGKYLDYINLINDGNNIVFSIDIPSGVSATSGKILGSAIKADHTITFGYNKLGLILYPGCDYGAKVTVADIGFGEINPDSQKYYHYIYDNNDLSKMPNRKNDSHKGDYGKVVIVAGSIGMNGACYLASKAAYRSGAGIVKALIPEENRAIMQTMLPEAIISTYKRDTTQPKAIIERDKNEARFKEADIKRILEDISWANVIAIGPGLGKDRISRKLFEIVIKNAKVPLVIDADGINILAEIVTEALEEQLNKESEDDQLGCFKLEDINTPKARIKLIKNILPQNTILTPHLLELSRLLNLDIGEIKEEILEIANICTDDNKITFVIKDARTVVAFENSRFINTTGNSGMSTGGSGDVLTGIIASLLGQGLTELEAASLGVYIHGLAGDIACKEKNKYSLIASDMIDSLAKI